MIFCNVFYLYTKYINKRRKFYRKKNCRVKFFCDRENNNGQSKFVFECRESRRQYKKHNILGFLVLPKQNSLLPKVQILSFLLLDYTSSLMFLPSNGSSVLRVTVILSPVQARLTKREKNVNKYFLKPYVYTILKIYA